MGDHGDDNEPYYADFTKAKGPAASFLSRQAIDVLYWKDQKVTAGILGTGVMLYFLTSLRGYSYVALLSIVLLMHLLISIVMVQVSRLQGKIVPEGKPLQLDADVLKAGVEHVNKALLVYHSLLTCKDMAAAGKAMGGLWILYCLGTWFDGATLLLLVWVGAFSVPIGYEKNKKEVDAKLGLVQDKITELTKQLESKIPRAPKKTDAKDN